MLIYTKIAELQAFLRGQRSINKSVGFVPTMGALHEGHLSLILASRKSCDITVCSIFVNPTQFNDKNDLARYPRMPEKDAQMLEKAGCDVLFTPSVDEIYPDKTPVSFDFGQLDKVLEGMHRPGHFNGVAQVVKRLFEIVKPHKAFFGSKDYQQVMIVQALVKQMNSPVEIISCPILREPDGLAMSSRNKLLSEAERTAAGKIPTIMNGAAELAVSAGIKHAKTFVENEVSKQPLMKLQYYEVCRADDLQVLDHLQPGEQAVSLIALFVGNVRMIDNVPVHT